MHILCVTLHHNDDSNKLNFLSFVYQFITVVTIKYLTVVSLLMSLENELKHKYLHFHFTLLFLLRWKSLEKPFNIFYHLLMSQYTSQMQLLLYCISVSLMWYFRYMDNKLWCTTFKDLQNVRYSTELSKYNCTWSSKSKSWISKSKQTRTLLTPQQTIKTGNLCLSKKRHWLNGQNLSRAVYIARTSCWKILI